MYTLWLSNIISICVIKEAQIQGIEASLKAERARSELSASVQL